jgi:hypothetical protein
MTSNKTWEVQVFKLSSFANCMQNISYKKRADPQNAFGQFFSHNNFCSQDAIVWFALVKIPQISWAGCWKLDSGHYWLRYQVWHPQ